jgi:hypothetical protein
MTAIRIGNLVWKEALQFWRNKLLLIFLLVFPALNMFGPAEAVAAEVMHIPTAVYDQDRSRHSRELVSMLEGSHLFDADIYVGSQKELERLLKEGTVKVGLVIPPEFGSHLISGRGATVQVLQDGADTLTTTTSAAYLEGALTCTRSRSSSLIPAHVSGSMRISARRTSRSLPK